MIPDEMVHDAASSAWAATPAASVPALDGRLDRTLGG